jgi:hypothetical protein
MGIGPAIFDYSAVLIGGEALRNRAAPLRSCRAGRLAYAKAEPSLTLLRCLLPIAK